MARSPLRVAAVGEDDHASFLDLWVRRRVESGASPESSWRAAREGRFAAVLRHDGVVVLLGHVGHEPVGYLLATVGPLSLLTEHTSVTVEDMYVDPLHRGRGVALAMLRALAHQAERAGIAHVGVNVAAQDRGAQRTLARLGFGSLVTRRVSTTAGLLRRLDGDVDRGQRAVLHRRRVQRAQRGAG